MPTARRTQQGGKRRNGALDGLRAFAIIAIVLYHLSVPWLPSGHMGVVVFFVISGYLVSSNILRTMRREGVSLPRLYLKRVLRIWPPMFCMLAFTVAACVIFNHILLTKLRPDLIPSLLLSNNLGAILRGASYFDHLGGTSPLTHLWYLGVDLQFFIVWAAICTFLCPRGRSTRKARYTALILAAISAIAMAVLYDPNADPTRVYYGPDTRAFAPLLGAWLGLAWPLGGRPVRLTRTGLTLRHLPLDLFGVLALIGIVLVMLLVPDTSVILYRGGMLVVAVLSCVLLAACLNRRSLFARVFSLLPLSWLGTRSFGLYLWHFPIFQLLKVTNNETPAWVIVIAIALSLAASELSVRLIEQPLSKNNFPLVIGPLADEAEGWVRYLAFAPAAAVAIALCIGCVGLAIVPDEKAVPDDAIQSTGVSASEARDVASENEQNQTAGDTTDKANAKDSTTTTSVSLPDKPSKPKPTQDLDNLPTGSVTLEASEESVSEGLFTPTIIADSVAGDAQWYFDTHMPNALLDSYVGRRPDQALSVLKGYLDQGVVGNIVILDAFSNTPTTDDVMTELIESCGDRHVYLVNVRIPEVEQEQINACLDRFAAAYDNVELIDWYAESEGHNDWLYSDGEHLTPEGQPHYVDMISNAIARDFAADGGTVIGEEPEVVDESSDAVVEQTEVESDVADETDDTLSEKSDVTSKQSEKVDAQSSSSSKQSKDAS